MYHYKEVFITLR